MSFKSICFGFFVVFLSYNLAHGALFRERYAKHPVHQVCYSRTFKVSIKAGHTVQLKGMCMEATCARDYEIIVASCPSMSVSSPCIMVPGNLSLPYPECCDQPYCPPGRDEDNMVMSMLI